MSYLYLGLDPGASGGLAALYPQTEGTVVASKMPSTERGIWDWLRNCSSNLPIRAAIEQVGGYFSSDYGRGGMGASMFHFGQGYGFLRGCLTVLKTEGRLEWVDVTPGVWQRSLGITPRGKSESKTDHKNRLKERAQHLFPELKVTLATADALLLAIWCRNHYTKVSFSQEKMGAERIEL